MIARLALLSVIVAGLGLAQPKHPLPADTLPQDLFSRPIPLGLEALTSPWWGEAATAARFDLGRRLFFDPVLSRDRRMSCATCHDPRHGFATRTRFPLGVAGKPNKRHPPTLFNRGFGGAQSWDGSAEDLEAQMLLPIANPIEMDLPLGKAIARLRAHAEYGRGFEEAWGAPPDEAKLAASLALFVSRLTEGDSPIDRFRAGKDVTLTAAQRTGLWVFESKGRCWTCHSGPNFTDERFHATGVGVRDGEAEPGRFGVTGEARDRGRFKTPTLRGLTKTAPYMHDGSLETLADVVAFYRRGGNPHPQLDARMKPLDLTDEEARGLVAFLEALSR